MESDLEQQVAKFVTQFVEIVLLDGIGDLVGLFERVWRDGPEVLLQVPGATAAGIAQAGHDFQQALNRHGSPSPRALRATSAACRPSRPRC